MHIVQYAAHNFPTLCCLSCLLCMFVMMEDDRKCIGFNRIKRVWNQCCGNSGSNWPEQMCPVWKPPKTQHTTNLNIPAESCHDGSSAPPGTHTHLQHAPQGPDPSLPAETRTHAPLPLDPPHASYTHKYMYKCDPGAQNQSYVAQVYL